MTYIPDELLKFLAQAAHLQRSDIWTDEPIYYPTVRQEFAMRPRLGFIGQNYVRSGTVLIGANPSSTEGQSAAAVKEKYAMQDKRHIALFEAFRRLPSRESHHALNAFERQDMEQHWHMNWVMKGCFERLRCTLDDVAVLNVIPFSTKDAPPAKSSTWRNAVRLYLQPLMAYLKPNRIIWMGLAAQKAATPFLTCDPSVQQPVINRQRNLKRHVQFQQLDVLLGNTS